MAKKLKIPSKKKSEKLRLFSFEENGEREKNNDIKSHIEIFSNDEITVENCRGILEYNSNYIKLRLLKGGVTLFGTSLCVTFFENDVIRIKGKFSSLEFCV